MIARFVEQDGDGGRTCRFCLSSGEGKGEEDDGPLIAPCGCKGSNRWIHRGCLDAWRLHSVRTNGNVQDIYDCPTCHERYDHTCFPLIVEGRAKAILSEFNDADSQYVPRIIAASAHLVMALMMLEFPFLQAVGYTIAILLVMMTITSRFVRDYLIQHIREVIRVICIGALACLIVYTKDMRGMDMIGWMYFGLAVILTVGIAAL